jgi:alpha-glucuronidase
LIALGGLHAETGANAWLRYAALNETAARPYRQVLPSALTSIGNAPVIGSARQELIRGIRSMLGQTLRVQSEPPKDGAIVLGTLARIGPRFGLTANLEPDAYWLKTAGPSLIITASNDRGILYGAFALLRKIATGESIANLDEKQSPSVRIRWVNQWDNLDGTIERGYGGRSIFWENGHVRADLNRVGDYGRLLASLGINGCSIDNVNADPHILGPEFVPRIARVAAALRPWGVQIALSVDFGSPKAIGGLDSFDPLDPRVTAWWKTRVDALYKAVPDLGGFVLKADSEGRVGPSTYGRTHAEAANMVARALKPHGGLLFYRGFVYDHHMDWRNPKNDRARAAYDNFHPLDGQFDDNVILQVKNGPIDFQVREPASPLFSALTKTNKAIELQITQEYMGQGRYLVFLAPMWKDVLDFDMGGTPVKSLVSTFAGVANVGLDENWLRSDLSQANLYGFGRLAWDPNLSARQIVEEWARQTFPNEPKVVETIANLQLASWRAYENYTGPFGLQTLTDITGNHYGVSVEASERNGWGQWHNADEKGVGMDRTVATGTGYIGQYPPAVAKMYESLETCPDDLLLFLHHVPYTYKLHSGKTVIQAIYDAHYDGAATAADYVRQWKQLAGLVDDGRYQAVLAQLEFQAGQAEGWRDAVNNWFFRTSGIPDEKGRVGHHPGRIEAEGMQLEGYAPVDVMPWEAASGGKAVACEVRQCAASFRYDGPPGRFTIRIQYFDQNNGVSRFRLLVSDQQKDAWSANNNLPTKKIDGSSSTRRSVRGVALRPGDPIRVEGIPDGEERAAIDYVEILPDEN